MALLTLAQGFGNNLGLAIITLSLATRLALLPLTLHLARRAQAHGAKLKLLQPEIELLKQRHCHDQQRFGQEVMNLYERHGHKPFDAGGLVGGVLQLPLFAGLYTAINQGLGAGGRFLWVPNLAQPDAVLALTAAFLTYAASALNPDVPQNMRFLVTVVPAMLSLMFMWRAAAGLGLYFAASNSVGLLQAAILRRPQRR